MYHGLAGHFFCKGFLHGLKVVGDTAGAEMRCKIPLENRGFRLGHDANLIGTKFLDYSREITYLRPT